MTPQDLRRVLAIGRVLTSSVDKPEARRRVWLVDEVNAITSWSAILKGARDNTEFGDDTVVATGSRWADGETSRETCSPDALEKGLAVAGCCCR
jgi:hypothetical protein